MILKIQSIFFALAILIFTSCSGQQRPTTKQSFPSKTTLNETLFMDCSQSPPDYLNMYSDSVLILVNSMPTGKSKYHFSLYSTNGAKLLTQRMEFGRKYGQAMGFVYSGVLKNGNIWAHDINKKTVVFTGFKDFSDTASFSHEHNLLSGTYRSIRLLNDSVAIGSGNFNSDNKIDFLNLAMDGKVEKGIVPYSSDLQNPVTAYEKSANENFLLLKPSQDKCVLVCRFSDKIEIADLKSGKSTTLYGPEGFEPDMGKLRDPEGKEIAIMGENTKIAYLFGETTNKYIYLLFSGKTRTAANPFVGNKILVFDWNGKPIKEINLTQDIQAFTVSSDDKVIYTYDPGKKQIRIGKLI